MENKIILSTTILLLFVIAACAQTAPTTVEEIPFEPAKVVVVSETSITPEVGKVIDETEDNIIKEVREVEISEVDELLSKSDEKVQSLRYSYKGPETKDFFYEFVVKGNKIKYILNPDYKAVDVDDDAYDAIYMDTEFKTALAYCDDRSCYKPGKKAVLDYDENYILTPLDWLNKIDSAEKLGEELVGKRYSWRLLANDYFTVWIDASFGVPQKVEYAGNLYKFEKMSFNDVKVEDVSLKN